MARDYFFLDHMLAKYFVAVSSMQREDDLSQKFAMLARKDETTDVFFRLVMANKFYLSMIFPFQILLGIQHVLGIQMLSGLCT